MSPLFKRKGERVVAAHVEVSKALNVADACPLPISLGPGEDLIIQVPYRIKQVSRHYEEATITLRSRCGQRQHDPAAVHFEERIGRFSGKRGVLEQTWSWSLPGTHTVDVAVEAERIIQLWNSGQTVHSDRQKVAMRIVVAIEA